jgi:hypothetical protein
MVDIQANKIPRKIVNYWRSILIVVLIATVFSSQACTANKRGAATPDRVVEQYLLALETKDENSILDLAPDNSNFTREVKAKIGRIGGRKIQDRQIIYTKPKPILWNATIRGFYLDRNGTKQKIEDSIVLEYQNKGDLKLYAGRWYLSLGSIDR